MDVTEQVRRLLRSRPTLTLEEAAAALGRDRHLLQGALRAEAGLTFRRLRAEVIMALAVEKIAAGASLKSVAFDLGYSTERAFARAFERHIGTPPTIYREGR